MADLRGQIPVQITNMLMTHHIIEEVTTMAKLLMQNKEEKEANKRLVPSE